MKYVLLIMDTPNEPKPDSAEYGAWYAEVGAWYEKWGATGRLDGGHQLQGADSAKTVPGRLGHRRAVHRDQGGARRVLGHRGRLD